MKKLSIVFFLVLSLFLSNKNIVIAQENTEEKTNENYAINLIVPINHLDALNLIKQQVLEELTENSSFIDYNDIDIANTTVSLDKFDISKLSHTKVNVLVDLKYKNDINKLYPSTITLTASLDIIDTLVPEIVLTQDEVNIAINDEIFDPWAYVEHVWDNSKEYPTVALVNNVDVYNYGTYEVKYIASDSSSNKFETILKVNVVANTLGNYEAIYNGDEILYMLDLINSERARNSLNPLTLAKENGQIAVSIRAKEATSFLSHTRPDGSHYKTALIQQNEEFTRSPLEVLTYAGNDTYAKFNWWMHSKNHKAILMSPEYTTIAIAYSGKMWCAIVY